jgi:hypothetical protein
MSKPETYCGGCHCGAVRIEADVDLTSAVGRCNCTWCVKRGANGMILKPGALRLVAGEASLGEYVWGGKVGRYFFCKQCGVHLFSRGDLPQLGGEFAGLNVNCLDDIDPAKLAVVYWDGRHNNWQAGPRATPGPVVAEAATPPPAPAP